jgi:hypothetical protein
VLTLFIVRYPQNRTSDFVAKWNEKLFIRDMLELLFREQGEQGRRDWDDSGMYTVKEVGNMVVYAKTNDKFNTFDKQEVQRNCVCVCLCVSLIIMAHSLFASNCRIR